MKTSARLAGIVGDVRHETDMPRHESLGRHPIHATMEEAARLRKLGDKGESPATPAIVAAAVLAFVVPLAATFILVALVVSHFA